MRKISHLESKLGRLQPSRLITDEGRSISRVVKAHYNDILVVLSTAHHEFELGWVADNDLLIVIYILVDAPGSKELSDEVSQVTPMMMILMLIEPPVNDNVFIRSTAIVITPQ
jgi:hypothetical protein